MASEAPPPSQQHPIILYPIETAPTKQEKITIKSYLSGLSAAAPSTAGPLIQLKPTEDLQPKAVPANISKLLIESGGQIRLLNTTESTPTSAIQTQLLTNLKQADSGE